MSPAAPDPSAIAVRRARPEEYAAVGDLTAEAYVAGGFATPDYVPHLRDAAARAAAGDLFVAIDPDSGALLGTASLFTASAGADWAEHAGPDEAVMRMLAVAADARRRGVGAALTRACIDRARELGCARLLLSTQVSMRAAHGLYESLGFRRAPHRDWEPVPGVDLMGYELEL